MNNLRYLSGFHKIYIKCYLEISFQIRCCNIKGLNNDMNIFIGERTARHNLAPAPATGD